MDAVKRKLEMLKLKQQQADETVVRYEREVERLTNEKVKNQEELDALNGEISKMDQEINEKELRYEDLKNDIASLEVEVEDEVRKHTSQTNRNKLTGNVGSLKSQCEELGDQKANMERDITAFENEISQLETKLGEIEEQTESLDAECRELEAQLIDLTNEARSKTHNAGKAGELFNKLDINVKKLEDKLAQEIELSAKYEQEVIEVENEISRKEAEYEDAKLRLEEKTAELTNLLEELNIA